MIFCRGGLLFQASIVKTQGGFTSTNLTVGVISAETWLFFSHPQDVFTDYQQSSLRRWIIAHCWIEQHSSHQESSINTLGEIKSTCPWKKRKWGDLKSQTTNLLFLELCFHHFDLWRWGFLAGFQFFYLTHPCNQSIQVLKEWFSICGHIPQCQGRLCFLWKPPPKMPT